MSGGRCGCGGRAVATAAALTTLLAALAAGVHLLRGYEGPSATLTSLRARLPLAWQAGASASGFAHDAWNTSLPRQWSFDVHGLTVVVPVVPAPGTVLPWGPGRGAEPLSFEAAAAQARAFQQAYLGSLATGVTRDEAARVLERPMVAMSHKAAILARVQEATRAALAPVLAPDGAVRVRDAGQYESGGLIIGRLLQYAANAEAGKLARGRLARASRALRRLGHRVRRLLGPLRSSSPPARVVVVLPVDLAQVTSLRAANQLRWLASRAVEDALWEGEGQPELVLLNSRVHRDMLVERALWPFAAGVFADALLARALFVSQEAYPPWGWGNTRDTRGLRQLDVPYSSALHRVAPLSPPIAAGGGGGPKEDPARAPPPSWPNMGQRASARPLRLVMVAGARAHILVRTRMRAHMAACANATEPPARSDSGAGGGGDGSYGSVLAGACAFWDLDAAAAAEGLPGDVARAATLGLYGAAAICVQPTGDTPMRRAFYDSLQMGCLPFTLRPGPLAPRSGAEPWRYPFPATAPALAATLDALFGGVTDADVLGGAWVGKLLALPPAALDAAQAALAAVVAHTQYGEPPTDGGAAQQDGRLRAAGDAVDALLREIASDVALQA